MIINMQSGGVVPERIIDAQTITPSTENKVFEEGTYLRGQLTILGDPDLTAENIPDDVNLFGIQGTRPSNEGNYCWKKSAYKAAITYNNPSFTLERTYQATKLVLKNCSFDCTRITDYINFFNGFTAYTPFKFAINNSKLVWYYESATLYVITGFNAISATQCELTLQSSLNSDAYGASQSYTYSGSKSVPEVKTLLKYIVSNDPEYLPDGALGEDGYYYELLAAVSSANAASLSDTALMTVQQDYRDTVEEEVSNANA